MVLERGWAGVQGHKERKGGSSESQIVSIVLHENALNAHVIVEVEVRSETAAATMLLPANEKMELHINTIICCAIFLPSFVR